VADVLSAPGRAPDPRVDVTQDHSCSGSGADAVVDAGECTGYRSDGLAGRASAASAA
jgi:hypothetical protein